MSYVIRNEGLAGFAHHGGDQVPIGAYLRSYDPDAHDGLGEANWTLSLDEAMQFETAADAFHLYRSVSTVRPTRGDGHANRPLTAFTVSVERSRRP